MGHVSPQPIVMTTSDSRTASFVRILGRSAVMSMPSSDMATAATALTWSAGCEPAERTSTAPPESRLRYAAAIWLRPTLCTHTNSTLGLSAMRLPLGVSESSAQRKADIDQPHQHGHLDEGADDPRERLPGSGSERGDRHRDGQLEVVAGRGEGEGGRAFVAEAEAGAQRVATTPHEREIGQQRQRDTGHVPGTGSDGITLEGEQHHDREQQPVERPRADAGQERTLVPVAALDLLAEAAREEPRHQGNAKEDQHRARNVPRGSIDVGLREAEPPG